MVKREGIHRIIMRCLPPVSVFFPELTPCLQLLTDMVAILNRIQLSGVPVAPDSDTETGTDEDVPAHHPV